MSEGIKMFSTSSKKSWFRVLMEEIGDQAARMLTSRAAISDYNI
ncbi:hypothetical protein GLYMA_16G081100v4 [Glycine max]|uniref:Uncharacterized protein n=1 Tax=Glycine max TaxID=3847 RepID=A0A0R0FMX8_SOYBN|nr:hypothetical protein GYH30_044479 [Glycine max]KRH07318.1 hypothetical protein GLYMA_16G081100v4 [Glycine max]